MKNKSIGCSSFKANTITSIFTTEQKMIKID